MSTWFYLLLKTENSRRIAESRPVCVQGRSDGGGGGGGGGVWGGPRAVGTIRAVGKLKGTI